MKHGSTLLNASEAQEHQADEAIIERGLKSFYEVGSALLRIRERRSYRDKYKTFEDYCRERWDFTKTYANNQILAAKVIDNLKASNGDNNCCQVLPQTESQCRPLAYLAPDQQREVWQRVVAGGQKITAKLIETVMKVWRKEEELKEEERWAEERAKEWEDRGQWRQPGADAGAGNDAGTDADDHNHYGKEEEAEAAEEEESNGWLPLMLDAHFKPGEYQMAFQILSKGYRAMAAQVHPDHKEGDTEDCVHLNNARDKMRKILDFFAREARKEEKEAAYKNTKAAKRSTRKAASTTKTDNSTYGVQVIILRKAA